METNEDDNCQNPNAPTEHRWIESEAIETDPSNKSGFDESGENDWVDIFADPDPQETFRFDFDLGDNNETVAIFLLGYKAELGQTLHSTGLTLWRASSILCDFLIQNKFFIQNKSVIELGSGLGLCGILAYHLGPAKIVLTDGDTDTLSNLRDNVERNHVTVEVKQLIWGTARNVLDRGMFDTILGSDIIYLEEMLDPLWTTVDEILSSDGVFLLAFARRNVSIDLVFQTAGKYGFTWKYDRSSESVIVFRRATDPQT